MRERRLASAPPDQKRIMPSKLQIPHPGFSLLARRREFILSRRSPDFGAPFLDIFDESPIERSATMSPTVPPERPDGMDSIPWSTANLCVQSASVMVPTWFGLSMNPSMEFDS